MTGSSIGAEFTKKGFLISDKNQLSIFFCLACGGTYQGRDGTISSPKYPNYYSSKTNCLFKILVPTGFRVKVTFKDFNLEDKGVFTSRYIS